MMHPPQLPESLESIQKAEYFSIQRHRWNTNEEIASILISFDKHEEWLSKEVKIRPKSGSMMLYSRKRVRYRRDGYCWKKRKDGKTTREDHMKLKVQGTECIYGCYVHSAILPTFHRRCYWLLQNPDIVLVHYLNVPYTDDNKIISPTLNYFADSKKEWTKEELISELKPMFFSESEPDLNNELELSTAETIEAIVQQLMAKQRAKVKAIEDATDVGINARALTVVAAVSTNSKEKMQSQRESQTKLTAPIPVAVKPASPRNPLLKRDVAAACIIATPTSATASRAVGNPGSVQLVQIGTNSGSASVGKTVSGHSTGGTPTSLIFNLSQFQNGSGLLILNSGTTSTHTCTSSVVNSDSDAMNAPVLLYSRTTSSNNASVTVNGTNVKPPGPIVSTVPMQVKPIITQKLHNLNHKPEVKQEPFVIETPNVVESKTHLNPSEGTNPIDVINGNFSSQSNVEVESPKTSSVSVSTEETLIPEDGEVIINNSNTIKNQNSLSLQLNDKYDLQQPNLQFTSDHYYQNVTHPQMPLLRSNNANDSIDLNPMDFIDNDISTPDEELFNLDAFDMLTEFPNLDDLANLNASPLRSNYPSNSAANPVVGKSIETYTSHSESHNNVNYREGTAQIADFSPDWSYPEGGIKILVVGPWYSSSLQYSILFNGLSVETSLVQNGVLRCYCPSHEPGFVTLQVACQGCIVSNSAIFEYKERVVTDVKENKDSFAVEDNVLKFCLLERLEILESHISFNSLHERRLKCSDSLKYTVSFEDQLVSLCEKMMFSPWLPCDDSSLTSKCLRSGCSLTDMSLLHLTAAMGYAKLTRCLLKWKNDNPSMILEMEVDAFSCDKNECTPLMWAFARGHKDTAILLYLWNKAAINLCDNQGCSPLHVARKKGFTELVDDVEKLADIRNMETDYEFESPKHKCCKTTKRDLECFSRTSRGHLNKSVPLDGSSHQDVSSRYKVSNAIVTYEMDGESGGASFSSQRSSLTNSCDITNDDGLLSVDSNSESSRVLAIAEHIIAAMPDRIKAASSFDADYEDYEPMLSDNHDNLNTKDVHHGSFSFEFSDYNYRHRDAGTPTSSPASSCLQSPGSFNNLDSPSPPPTAADFCEFFQASGKIMEKEFSNLTLSDFEQRELYEAARIIQKAYRIYKGRKRQEQEQEKEKQAAILIQSYYRRYKQYIYYKQMTKAAQVIQAQFRNYCENKRFKKGMNQDSYMTYGIAQSLSTSGTIRNPFYAPSSETDRRQSLTRESLSGCGLKRTYSQRRQNQAAKKIQQFLRQSKNKLQRERALAAKEGNTQPDQSYSQETGSQPQKLFERSL